MVRKPEWGTIFLQPFLSQIEQGGKVSKKDLQVANSWLRCVIPLIRSRKEGFVSYLSSWWKGIILASLPQEEQEKLNIAELDTILRRAIEHVFDAIVAEFKSLPPLLSEFTLPAEVLPYYSTALTHVSLRQVISEVGFPVDFGEAVKTAMQKGDEVSVENAIVGALAIGRFLASFLLLSIVWYIEAKLSEVLANPTAQTLIKVINSILEKDAGMLWDEFVKERRMRGAMVMSLEDEKVIRTTPEIHLEDYSSFPTLLAYTTMRPPYHLYSFYLPLFRPLYTFSRGGLRTVASEVEKLKQGIIEKEPSEEQKRDANAFLQGRWEGIGLEGFILPQQILQVDVGDRHLITSPLFTSLAERVGKTRLAAINLSTFFSRLQTTLVVLVEGLQREAPYPNLQRCRIEIRFPLMGEEGTTPSPLHIYALAEKEISSWATYTTHLLKFEWRQKESMPLSSDLVGKVNALRDMVSKGAEIVVGESLHKQTITFLIQVDGAQENEREIVIGKGKVETSMEREEVGVYLFLRAQVETQSRLSALAETLLKRAPFTVAKEVELEGRKEYSETIQLEPILLGQPIPDFTKQVESSLSSLAEGVLRAISAVLRGSITYEIVTLIVNPHNPRAFVDTFIPKLKEVVVNDPSLYTLQDPSGRIKVKLSDISVEGEKPAKINIELTIFQNNQLVEKINTTLTSLKVVVKSIGGRAVTLQASADATYERQKEGKVIFSEKLEVSQPVPLPEGDAEEAERSRARFWAVVMDGFLHAIISRVLSHQLQETKVGS